uniref:Rx_N domain-containing protein n=1 Tax=Caenorhabditis tropicalis TaxID=1561998 RepID=A0A1I7UEI6_9PELO
MRFHRSGTGDTRNFGNYRWDGNWPLDLPIKSSWTTTSHHPFRTPRWTSTHCSETCNARINRPSLFAHFRGGDDPRVSFFAEGCRRSPPSTDEELHQRQPNQDQQSSTSSDDDNSDDTIYVSCHKVNSVVVIPDRALPPNMKVRQLRLYNGLSGSSWFQYTGGSVTKALKALAEVVKNLTVKLAFWRGLDYEELKIQQKDIKDFLSLIEAKKGTLDKAMDKFTKEEDELPDDDTFG